MQNKYGYFVDNVKVSRSDFFSQLKSLSQTARRVDTIAGWCGVDIMEFDEKKYKQYMRDINNGIGIFINDGKYYKLFRRVKYIDF